MHNVTRLTTTPINEDGRQIDGQAVEFRLNNRKRMADVNPNTARTFALEISNGSMVRIHVNASQAEQFEQELSAAIAANPDADVGNLLYELTRFFDVYDIQWTGQFDDTAPVKEADGDSIPPEAAADAPEGEVPADGEAGDEFDDELNIDDNTTFDLDAIEPTDGDEEFEDEMEPSSLKDLLQSIVGQLNADSEARKAEAEAKKAEADAKKAEAVAKAMEIKVGRETEVAAMEEWEDEEKEKAKRQKEIDRLAKFRLAKKSGLADSAPAPKGKNVSEAVDRHGNHDGGDWGSSDWSIVLREVVRHIKKYADGQVNPQSIGDAALDAAESYHLQMGYVDPQDAADRIQHMFLLRVKSQGLEAVMAYDKPMTETQTAVATQMVKHLRRMTQAVRAKPQTNSRAFDNVEDTALDMMTDVQATRAQGAREVSQLRQTGAGPDEVRTAEQTAKLRTDLARKMATLKQQFDAARDRLN